MKKSLLWIVVLLLSVSMVAMFSLVGCDKGGAAVAETEEETTEAEEETTEAAAETELIKIGIVNLPPEESGYRQANVEDMDTVFSQENGYDAKFEMQWTIS